MQRTRTSVPQQAKSSNRHQWQCVSIIRMFFVCGPKSKIGDNTIRMFNIQSMPPVYATAKTPARSKSQPLLFCFTESAR